MSLASRLKKSKSSCEDALEWSGYRMIESIGISNFRCFESIRLQDCRRINVVVGRNASGKTALLEALFLASGVSPELGLRIKGWREQAAVLVSAEQSVYEGLWRDLFHKLRQNEKIFISFQGAVGFSRSLTISYGATAAVLLPVGTSDKMPQNVSPLVFLYEDEDKKQYPVSPVWEGNALKIPSAAMPSMLSVFFPSQQPIPAEQYARFFSDLSKKNRHKEIVASLQNEFQFLEDVTVEVGPGGESILYALIPTLPEKMALTLLSSGVNKLFCILLAIARQPKGVVLIDDMPIDFAPNLCDRAFQTLGKTGGGNAAGVTELGGVPGEILHGGSVSGVFVWNTVAGRILVSKMRS